MNKHDIAVHTISAKGEAAQRAGQPATACPYKRSSGFAKQWYNAWMEGWRRGERGLTPQETAALEIAAIELCKLHLMHGRRSPLSNQPYRPRYLKEYGASRPDIPYDRYLHWFGVCLDAQKAGTLAVTDALNADLL